MKPISKVLPWQMLKGGIHQNSSSEHLEVDVDLESRIFENGVLLTDLEPRNVIISSPDSDQG